MVRRGDRGGMVESSGGAPAYPHADGVRVGAGTGTLTVFNVCGNKYRLVVRINYRFQLINIRAVLTHVEYDKGKWKE